MECHLLWHFIMRVFGISGIEWWNGMLEWNAGVKHWNGILE